MAMIYDKIAHFATSSGANVMYYRFGDEQAAQPEQTQTKAQVYVFVVGEKILVEAACI